jgi:hypothetical protein
MTSYYLDIDETRYPIRFDVADLTPEQQVQIIDLWDDGSEADLAAALIFTVSNLPADTWHNVHPVLVDAVEGHGQIGLI